MNKRESELSIVKDLIDACYEACNDREIAKKAIRSICLEFGGGQVYIPKNQNGKMAKVFFFLFNEISNEKTANSMFLYRLYYLGGQLLRRREALKDVSKR